MAIDVNQSIYGSFGRRHRRRRRQQVGALPGGSRGGDTIRQIGGPTHPVDVFPNQGPSGGTGAPQTPTPAPVPYKPPPTFNPAYETGMAGVRQQYGNLMSQTGYSVDKEGKTIVNPLAPGQLQVSQTYGFDQFGNEITDPKDALFNPFNRMAMLRQSFQTANRAQTGSSAERGQLYSGALQSHLDINRNRFDEGEHNLKGDATGARNSLLQAWLSGVDDLTKRKYEYELENRNFQLEHPPAAGKPPTPGQPGQPPTPPGAPHPVDVFHNPRGVDVFHRKPKRDPKPGFRWVRTSNGKWVQRRRRTTGALPGGSRG